MLYIDHCVHMFCPDVWIFDQVSLYWYGCLDIDHGVQIKVQVSRYWSGCLSIVLGVKPEQMFGYYLKCFHISQGVYI